jgi:hypothetical protein
VIRSGVERGEFRPVDPNLATAWIVGMAQRAITFARAGRVDLPSNQVVERTVEAALRLLAR